MGLVGGGGEEGGGSGGSLTLISYVINGSTIAANLFLTQ